MVEATKRRISPLLRSYGLIEDGWSSLLVWIIGTYVILIPSISLIPSLGLYNEKRVLQIGLLLIGGGILLGSRSARQQLLSTFFELPGLARWGIGVVLGLGFLSSALAPAPFYAFLEVSHLVLLALMSGVIASAVRRAQAQTEKALLGVVAMSALLYVVYFAVAYGTYLAVADIEIWPDGGTNFANIRFFNQYQTWTLPLLGAVVLAVPERWRTVRGIMFGLLALWWSLVFASGVRGTIVAMTGAAIGVGVLFRRRAMGWFRVQGAALLAGVVIYGLLFYVLGTTPLFAEGISKGLSDTGRIAKWSDAVQMAITHPWLGGGPMHFAWPPYRFALGAHPHNALLQFLAEWGLPATIILLGLASWGGLRWIQQERSKEIISTSNDAVRVGLLAAVLAGGIHSLLSGIIVMPLSQMLVVLVLGWAWGRYKHNRRNAQTPSLPGHVGLCILLVASMAVVGSSFQDLTTIKERRSAFFDAVDRNRISPRYWLQGYIGVLDPDVIEQAQTER